MQHIRVNGTLMSCRTDASPLLTTMLNSLVPYDRDQDGNLKLDIDFDDEYVEDYVKFCNTGTIMENDNFIPELYSYMGHSVRYDNDDDLEYSKVRLMEIWHGSIGGISSSDDMNGLEEYADEDVEYPRIGIMHMLLHDLDYVICTEDRSAKMFGILNVDHMKIFYERYNDMLENDIVDTIPYYIPLSSLVSHVDIKDSVPTNIEKLRSIGISDKDILSNSKFSFSFINAGDVQYTILFCHSVAEFSHYCGMNTDSYIAYRGKCYLSNVLQYMKYYCDTYCNNVYEDCITETIVNGDIVLEWNEPIPKIPYNMDLPDVRVYVIDNIVNIDGLRLHELDDNSLIVKLISGTGCNKAIIHKV